MQTTSSILALVIFFAVIVWLIVSARRARATGISAPRWTAPTAVLLLVIAAVLVWFSTSK